MPTRGPAGVVLRGHGVGRSDRGRAQPGRSPLQRVYPPAPAQPKPRQHVLFFFAIPRKTIINNANKPYQTRQGQDRVGTRLAHPGWLWGKREGWREGGGKVCRHTPHAHLPHAAPVSVEKGGSRISPLGEGPVPGAPTRVWWAHAGGTGHLHRGRAGEADLTPPGQRCRRERPAPRVSAATARQRQERTGREGSPAMPEREASRGRGRGWRGAASAAAAPTGG